MDRYWSAARGLGTTTLNNAGVKVFEILDWELEVFQTSEEVQALSGFNHSGVDVMCPRHALTFCKK